MAGISGFYLPPVPLCSPITIPRSAKKEIIVSIVKLVLVSLKIVGIQLQFSLQKARFRTVN